MLLLLISLLVPSFVTNGALAQEESVNDPAPQVNLEIILDSSGSMANLTDTGETRMDAAKRVLTEVINSLPQRAGQVNVGFRIYGHRGDNSDATRDESCKASDLLAPVSGVDQPALIAAVNSAQPTGWTPIARSLSRSGKDFPEAGPSIANTVLLVTDGLETCDGDPVKVAGDLHEKQSVQMTTHVVGFGTTPEEQSALQGIATAGGGQLFGASNAQQLRAALFDVLEQLQIVVGVGYVGGNAFGILPAGNAGEFSVVGVTNSPSRGTLSFALRNNTGSDVAGLKVNVTVRDGAETLIAAGSASQVSPFFVRAGGVAFGEIWLGADTVIPADAQYEWNIDPSSDQTLRSANKSDLEIVEASLFDNRVAGTVKNGFDETVKGMFFFFVACFDESGAMTGTEIGALDLPELAPGEEQAFQVDLYQVTYEGRACPAFLVAGDGRGPAQVPAKPTTSESASASAPSPTPVIPTSDEASGEFQLDGVQDAALRTFTSGASVTTGLLSLSSSVFVFADDGKAAAAVNPVLDRYFAVHEFDQSTVAPVSAPKVGDERKAVTFAFDESGFTFQVAILVVRQGNAVYFLMTFARDVNPMDSIAEVTNVLFAPNRVTVADGGAMALLPTLDEVPFGLSIELEKIPEDWGPVPAN
jgi:hypothetical protein